MTTDDEAIRRHRWRLAIPVVVAVLLLGGYTALWFHGAGIMRAEIAAWTENERAEGRLVEHGDIAVRGYPGTLRAEVDAPVWSDPGVWAWQAETLYVITEPLNPRTLLLTPRGEQRVAYGDGSYDLRAEDLRVALSEGAVAVDVAGLSAESGEQVLTLGAGRAQWARNEDGSAALGLSFGQVAYTGSDARYAVPQLNAALSEERGGDLRLDAFEGAIGAGEGDPVLLAGQGGVGLDAGGYPSGQMTLTVRNADALAPFLIELGVIEPNQRSLIEMAAAGFADEAGAAALPLAFRDGKLRVGGFPVGDLPRF